MSTSLTFKTLFEIEVLHAYHLNSGTDAFSEMQPEQQRLLLRNYAFGEYLDIVPTAATRETLKNQRMLIRMDATSMKVLVTTTPANTFLPLVPISDDLELQFLVKIGDPFFEHYTDLTFVKNELFVFSNTTPKGAVGFPYIPLSSEGKIITDDYRMTGLVSEPLLAELTMKERVGLLGLLTLRMHGEMKKYEITEISAIPGEPAKVRKAPLRFELEFANRSTIWAYYFKKLPYYYYAETLQPKPLTKNGYVEITPGDLVLKHTDPDVPVGPGDVDLGQYHYPAPDVRGTRLSGGNYESVIYI